jgi:hypothetical protein
MAALLLLIAEGAFASQDLFIHTQTDFLASDSTSYYTQDTVVGNVSGQPWVLTDSTFFVRWNNDGRVLSKELIRAERHVQNGAYREIKKDTEEFLSPLDTNQRLSALRLSLAHPVHDISPTAFSCRPAGVFLELRGNSVLILPSDRLLRFAPEYGSPTVRVLNLFSGQSYYYLQLQEDCLDVAEDCRQFILPLGKDTLKEARLRLAQNGRK